MTHQYLAIQQESYVIHIEHIQQSFHLPIADSIRPFGIRRLQFSSVSISLGSSESELRSTRLGEVLKTWTRQVHVIYFSLHQFYFYERAIIFSGFLFRKNENFSNFRNFMKIQFFSESRNKILYDLTSFILRSFSSKASSLCKTYGTCVKLNKILI